MFAYCIMKGCDETNFEYLKPATRICYKNKRDAKKHCEFYNSRRVSYMKYFVRLLDTSYSAVEMQLKRNFKRDRVVKQGYKEN